MERISPARARRLKRRSAYHRLSGSGELVRVRAIEHRGRHHRLTLEDGRSFLVDPDHLVYLAPKEEQLALL
jgi:intein/homing endonuclease